MHTLTVYITEEQYERLREKAFKNKVTISSLIRKALGEPHEKQEVSQKTTELKLNIKKYL